MSASQFRNIRSGAALAFALAAPIAQAVSSEDDSLEMWFGDKLTFTTATGFEQRIASAPAVATVITAEDIAASGATDLDEVLETVPGLHVGRSANLYGPQYGIRGIVSAFTPQVLMLQNGIPMTTMLVGNNGNIWGGLPLENVARIEILRGPGSALYGADAYSGVINIFTKTAAETPGTQVGIRGGSFDSRDTWVQHGGQLGPVDVAAYLRVGTTKGFREIVTADSQSRNDGLFGTHASLAPGPVNTGHDAVDGSLNLSYEKWRLHAGYKLRDNVGTGAGIASALDPVGRGKSERITSDLSWTDPQFARHWGVGFTAGYLQYTQLSPTDYRLYPPGASFPSGTFPDGMIGGPDTWERQVRLSAFASYTGFTGHRLRVGLGHDDLNMYQTRENRNFTFAPDGSPVPTGAVMDFSGFASFVQPHRRKVSYLYAQDEWNFAEDWALTAGLRHDNYSDFGGTTNPRLALVRHLSLDLTAKLLYGRAFRAPAFVEAYSINNPVARGNPDLRPEAIETLEAAFAWQARQDTQVNVTFFHYTMNDIIRTVPNATPGTGATYSNTGKQHGNGVELEAVWDAGRSLRLSGHFAYQHSIDESTHQDAGYAPRKHAYARADWRFAQGLLLSTQANRVADRKRVFGDDRPQVPDYTTVDVTLRTASPYKNAWDFAASVRNLFDTKVLEPSFAPGLIPNDLPQPRRSFYAQASYRF